jgi:hypothetical protein
MLIPFRSNPVFTNELVPIREQTVNPMMYRGKYATQTFSDTTGIDHPKGVGERVLTTATFIPAGSPSSYPP